MLQQVRMDDGSALAVPGVVPKLSLTPGGHRRNAPALGQDTDAVLREIGLTPQQVQALKERGIVKAESD
jgi:formyl-CoA transferase